MKSHRRFRLGAGFRDEFFDGLENDLKIPLVAVDGSAEHFELKRQILVGQENFPKAGKGAYDLDVDLDRHAAF